MAKIKSIEQSLEVRLGYDTRFPIQGSFSSIKGVDLLIQDIQQLLLTIPGERPFRPEFGCELRNMIWENMSYIERNGTAAIRGALEEFEPRITVTNVEIEDINENTGLFTFRIGFIINEQDTPVNLIFPFRQGTQLSF